jgi:hypothetical protein
VTTSATTIHHARLGELVWDDDCGWYETTLTLPNGRVIDVSVASDDAPSEAPPSAHLLDGAAARVKRIGAELERIQFFAARELGKRRDGAATDEWDFVARLTIESIAVNSDLTVEVWFDDGGLFDGHAISVELDEHGQPLTALIAD